METFKVVGWNGTLVMLYSKVTAQAKQSCRGCRAIVVVWLQSIRAAASIKSSPCFRRVVVVLLLLWRRRAIGLGFQKPNRVVVIAVKSSSSGFSRSELLLPLSRRRASVELWSSDRIRVSDTLSCGRISEEKSRLRFQIF
ncbi:hypothetical protein LWI29_037916 [Acer saccharum]|uniref:Uncharacterized protein n=1 Tax=Acer saccharum TaxID=4024 RepID=A0AA39VAB8_ACESA|nr:hypothetical protein LWI29_037916 [Acer saccharum]